MQEVKIVIGANFGDEGKGQMTEYLAWQAIQKNKSVVIVKHNGGAQAGHTIIQNGKRYIFHHFGSGTLLNVPTYLSQDFLVNPMLFRKEFQELEKDNVIPHVYINKNCLFTTPYEMIINQVVEEARGSKKHGSCGIGIFETVKRGEKIPIRLKEMRTSEDITKLLSSISEEWLHDRLLQHNIHEMEDWIREDVKKMLQSYINDFQFMLAHARLVDNDFMESYHTVIYETAQGLLLDKMNMEYFPHLTPSYTGAVNPAEYLKPYKDVKKEIIYVTRTYMTRHGAGMFKTECKKEDINADMYDETNVPNKYQDTLRYGYMDMTEFYQRILDDALNIPSAKVSVAVMHMNETDGCFVEKDKRTSVFDYPNIKYVSNGPSKENITAI